MPRRLAPAFFVVSGVAGLVLQVAWFRFLALSLGGTLAAATVVLTAFMGGLALGAWAWGRRAQRLRSPLRTYGLLEAGAGAAALLTLPLLWKLDAAHAAAAHVLGDRPVLLLACKLVLATVVLLPVTIFMGGTLPVLCQALASRPETVGIATGSLYALNTWGAVGGSLLAIFVLLPRWGLWRSVLLGAGLDLAVAACVLAMVSWSRERSAQRSPADEAGAPALTAPAGRLRLFSTLLFLVGFAGIAYEVLWTRALAFYFGSGAHAFALVLAVVLVGLALGAFLGGALADRLREPALVLAGSQALLAVAVAYQVWWMPKLPDFLYDLAVRFPRGLTFSAFSFVLLVGAVQLLLPATVLMGAALPSAVRSLARAPHEAGPIVGRLSAANTLGTIPGAIVAAWALIPAVGLERSLFAVAALNLVVAALAAHAVLERRRRAVVVTACVALAALLAVALGVDPMRVFRGSGVFTEEGAGSSLLRVEESPHGTVTLSQMRDGRGAWLSLAVDGVNVAGTSPPLLSCQTMQGQLPLLLHRHPTKVMHVGFGSGGTAAAVATHAEVTRLDVVEINPAILRMSGSALRAVNGGILADPRVHVRFQDGRNELLGTNERYDCILSDSIHPRYRGNASLYTVEYFALCRARLAPGGLVSTWLPVYSLSADSLRSIVRSMREVFPATSLWYLNSTVNEFVILIGRTDSGAFDVARMKECFADAPVAESLGRVGVTSPADVLDFFIAEGSELDGLVDDVELHHDDRPWVEFQSATVMDRDASWRQNLARVIAARQSVVPHLAQADEATLADVRRHEEATTMALRGHLAILARDRATAANAFAGALAADPQQREPWDWYGVPAWVRSFGADGDVPREEGGSGRREREPRR